MKTKITKDTTVELIQNTMAKTMSYAQYRVLVAQLASENRTTGPEQTEALVQYTQLNDRRMKRWDKTLKFSDLETEAIKKEVQRATWLVLTESWCGDASPALPVMHKITEINSNISLQIVLRDEHPELMDRFLTNGGRSIPKLLVVDDVTGKVIGDWGPRSRAATLLVETHKAQHGNILPEFKEELQRWYNKDRGQSILNDLLHLLD